MSKSANTKIVLCFKEGEPYLYDKEKKEYISLSLNLQNTISNVKNIISQTNYKTRPAMREIWQILASTIPHCDGFCNKFSIKTSHLTENCFENFFSREITVFLNTLFSPQLVQKNHELKRKYEKNYCNRLNFSESAQRNEKNLLMAQKKGRRLYH